MQMDDRIVYDAAALVRNVENSLDMLKRFQYDSHYRTLLGDGFIAKLSDWDRQIRSRKDDPFTLVVCGDFKRGKSSIINALLGDEVVTANVTTETVTLNRISYGNHSNEAVLSGGRKLVLTDQELKRDQLQTVMEQAGEPITELHIRRSLEFLKNVTVIDTPGLGDAFKDFSSLVREALAQADAVVYVFSVSYPLSQQELLFLKTAVLPQRYTAFFLVGNFADTMPDEDSLTRMGTLIQKKIRDILPGKDAYMVSALDEQCMQMGAERPNGALADILAANFAKFRHELEKLVADKKDYVLPERMERLLGLMKAELETSLHVMKKGLSMDEKGIQAALGRLNEEKERQIQIQADMEQGISEKMKTMKEEALAWMGGLVDRMEAEVDGLDSMDATLLTKYYSFYCIDLLQQGMDRCTSRHQEELYDALEEISCGLAESLSDGLGRMPYSFRFSLDNKTWTKGDNVSYVISKVDSSGLLTFLADGFVLGGMRQKELAGKTLDVLKSIHKQYANVRASVIKMVEKTYADMEELAKRQLQGYYSDKIASAQADVEQSAMVARRSAETKKEVGEALDEIFAALEEIGRE